MSIPAAVRVQTLRRRVLRDYARHGTSSQVSSPSRVQRNHVRSPIGLERWSSGNPAISGPRRQNGSDPPRLNCRVPLQHAAVLSACFTTTRRVQAPRRRDTKPPLNSKPRPEPERRAAWMAWSGCRYSHDTVHRVPLHRIGVDRPAEFKRHRRRRHKPPLTPEGSTLVSAIRAGAEA